MNGTLMHPATQAPRPDQSSARWIPSGTCMTKLIARQARYTSATSAKWKYRAIYSNDAQRIGQWSNVAEIMVGG